MVLMIPKGKYRNYCVIESATRTSDSQGGWTLAWATAGSDWFRAIPVSQNKTLDQGGVKYTLAVEFYQSKYGFALTTDHRIVWNSQNFTINSIVPSEKLDENKIIAYV